MRIHLSHFLFAVLLIIGLAFPREVTDTLLGMGAWFVQDFGLLMLFSASFFLLFCLYLAFSRYGKMRLGGPDERPEFSWVSWMCMLFAAGIGSGLVFYGAAEPLMHYMNPPPSPLVFESDAHKAHHGLAITYFHWGFHAWAIYGIAALTIAYFTFHKGAPMLPSTPITRHPLFRDVIDSIAIIAVVFGIVSSLSQGVLQVSSGISDELGLAENGVALRLMVLGVLFVCYMASACTEIGKGIKILSNINIIIALALLLFIFFASPIMPIIEMFIGGMGEYLGQFAALSYDVQHLSNKAKWSEDWSITYLLWWVAWAPFVGVFIARVSRGRTIREFILGVIILPTIFSAIWFAVLGGSALHLEMVTQPGFAEVISEPEKTTFALLDTLPISTISSVTVILLLFIFLVTSADSGTFVLGMFTSQGSTQPSAKQRLFWGGTIALITGGAMLQGSSLTFFRSIVVVGAIPYLIIMLWQNWGFWRTLRADAIAESTETDTVEDY